MVLYSCTAVLGGLAGTATMDQPPSMGGTPRISVDRSDPDTMNHDKYEEHLANEGVVGRALDASKVFKWSINVRERPSMLLAGLSPHNPGRIPSFLLRWTRRELPS